MTDDIRLLIAQAVLHLRQYAEAPSPERYHAVLTDLEAMERRLRTFEALGE